jgi:tetratricopeptide (TPR) repeat protein
LYDPHRQGVKWLEELAGQPQTMIGQTIAHYQILDKLGEGGMGVVYKARDTHLDRFVAIKVLPPEKVADPERKRRFGQEAKAASALNHPNIITIHDISESEAGQFIVMELIEGRTLRALAGSSLQPVCQIGSQAARALAAAHAAGIVHRDIKPENIMVRDDGFVKVLDFGLARVLPTPRPAEETQTAPITGPGMLLGTVRYMSPEQGRGEATSSATDVFSLGIVLYELAAARHPFAADSQLGTLNAILSQPVLPPSRLKPEIAPAFEALVLRMLEKDPRLRPTAAEVESALAELAGQAPRQVPAAPSFVIRRHTVGRQRELAELQAALQSAASGRGLMLCLAGEAGIGKTTVVENFFAEVINQGRLCYIARGRCSERLAGSEAYLPLLEALESLLHGEAGESVSRVMKVVAPTWYVQIAPLAAEDSSFARVMAEAKAASQERMKRELAAFLQEIARLRPLIVFLDDLHWADISTVDLLSYIGSKCEAMRMLLIGTYRPSDLLLAKHPFLPVKLELQGRGLAREISVEFLRREDVESYLALEFPENLFPPELAPLLHARTEGNPLFMVDLVRYLRDRGVIAEQQGRWALGQSVLDLQGQLPESVRSMIQKKIDQLSEPDRKLLVAASVQGHEFDSAVVAKAAGTDPTEVEERLEGLDRVHALVRLVGDREFPDSTLTLRYSFLHVLYQNALYASLTATRKASLSAAVAQALLGFYGDQSSEVAAELALLFEAGRDFARASDYFLMAAQNATRVYANQEALALARRAIANAEKLKGQARHSRVAAAALLMAQIHQTLTQLEEALADCILAEESARIIGDQETQISAILGHVWALITVKRLEEADKQAARGLELARLSGSAVTIASAEGVIGWLRNAMGDPVEADEYCLRAIPVLQREAPPLTALMGCTPGLWVLAYRLEYEEWERLDAWMQQKAEEVGGHFYLCCNSYVRGLALGNQGRISQALSTLQEVRRIAELNGDRYWLPRVPNALGWLHRELLDLETALWLDDEGARMAREMVCDEAEANSHVNLGHDYLALGEPARAYEHLEEAGRIFQRDVWNRWRYNIRLQAEQASYWIAGGDLEKAAAHAAASLEVAKKTLVRKHWAWAHKLFGDIAMLQDRLPDARSEYDVALGVLQGYPCPVIEWKILAAASQAARGLKDDSGADDLRRRARHVIETLAGSITEVSLRERFLSSKPVRDL